MATRTRLLAMVWPELRVPEADPRPFEPMLDALDDLSPRIEAVDVGVALVDVTGLGPMWGPERRIAARAVALARAVAPLHVRCGIGDNRWLATLAARLARPEREGAPAALRTLERDELPDLPIGLLPADAATRQRFGLFGLTVMRQLAELPRSAVGAQFGPPGERLQALARGHDPRPLVPRRRPERVEADAAFDPPLDGVGTVGLTLRRLAAELCDRLRARHLAPGRATLVLRLEDGPPLRVAQAFPQPALEPDWIARLLLSRIEAAARARAVAKLPSRNVVAGTEPMGPIPAPLSQKNLGESATSRAPKSRKRNQVARWQLPDDAEEEPRIASVTLAFDRLSDPSTTQLPAFEARAARGEELRWSLERIRHRFGDGRLWRAQVDRPHAALPEHRACLVDIGS
ncbi:MAG TPA: hypothetical protein VHR55_06940 [Candidatus Limnocylindria bacterium]|nr:hypothetical protein [Candidatus Limnocylindria bacterium]